jgi:rhamnogalacturonyl hydrolase YesR
MQIFHGNRLIIQVKSPVIILNSSLIKVLLIATIWNPFQASQANEPLTFRQKTSLEEGVIMEAMVKAKEWQEAQHGEHIPTNWLTGAFYSGVFACYQSTGLESFLASAREWCEAAAWKCGDERPLHADDICSAQTFLDVYSVDQDPAQIKHIRDLIDRYYIGQEVIRRELMGNAIWGDEKRPWNGRNLWWWCDALYMAPPVLARLATHTGDPKYRDLMHGLYWDAVDYLYDPTENLFFRDSLYFNAQTPNGKKLFWGRGNGWVVGGLVRTIDYLPDEDPYREEYLALFRDMMRKIASLQGEDGLWGSSVNDRAWLPEPESSGSSFYCFGLAAGINRGWLDERTYLPHAVRAWEGLLSCLREDGRLEWAQLVDEKPRKARHEDQKNYAQGAFLLAASEMYRLQLTPEKYSDIMGPRRIVKVAGDGAWTWYNDERSVFWNKHLLTGHVTSNGISSVSVYLLPGRDLITVDRLNVFPLSTWKEADDHNNPAFLRLSSNELLAVYARHNTRQEFNTRIIQSDFTLQSERTLRQPERVTYSNLFILEKEEDRIYNFFRCLGFSPTVTWSDDHGKTWSEALQLLNLQGVRARPYVKYAGNNQGRIDLFYTDGHPRDIKNNNVYHLYYEGGAFYRSNGKKIKSMEKISASGPMLTREGTRIFDGSGKAGRGWVHDFERGRDGELAGVFISSPDGDEGLDLRYHYCRFDPSGEKWTSREIAFAGPHLYVPENHYAGGICIDPSNINVVYLSSCLNPSTGEPNGTGKFQIYRGVTEDRGKTWFYEQLTFDLKRDNLRPFVPRERPEDLDECLLWFRGVYRTYEDFDTEIVGFIK